MTNCNLVINCLLCTNGIYSAQFYPTGKAKRGSLFLICGNRRLKWHLLTKTQSGNRDTTTELLIASSMTCLSQYLWQTAGFNHSPNFLRICTDNAQAACSISLQWNSMWKTTVHFQRMLLDMGLGTKIRVSFGNLQQSNTSITAVVILVGIPPVDVCSRITVAA